jgi:hypothetical protein
MPRESIAMSRDEVLAMLRDERRTVIGTLDSDGRVWPDAAACMLSGDLVIFRLPLGSRAQRNIQRDNRVCFERFPSYYQIKGVTVHGRAIPVNGGTALDQVPNPVTGQPVKHGENYMLTLDDTVSFDFAKIKNKVAP